MRSAKVTEIGVQMEIIAPCEQLGAISLCLLHQEQRIYLTMT